MFKTTVGYEQSRTRRAALHSTRNRSGVCGTVFQKRIDAQADYSELILVRSKVCLALAKVNHSLAKEYGKLAKHERYRNDYGVRRLEEGKARLESAFKKANASLQLARKRKRAATVADQRDLEHAFMDEARKMLADQVFNRVLTATVHIVQAQIESELDESEE